MPKINIHDRVIGLGHPCYVIAEIGLNHNGDIDLAKKLIDEAVSIGADCVKFQKRDVDGLAVKEYLDAKDDRFPEFGKTYREIRQHLEFSFQDYCEIISYSRSRNIDFLCTPFDIKSVDLLEKLGVNSYKIASHSLTNLPLIKYIAKIQKPLIISTGMASVTEIDTTIRIIKDNNCPYMLLHCVSSYPQSPEESNLNLMAYLRNRYNVPVGYSGHEIGINISLAAIALGASVIERHFTLDKKMVGFDHKLSLEPKEFKNLILGCREIELSLGKGIKQILKTEWVTRQKYHSSIVSKMFIPKGKIITEDYLTVKNPGIGIESVHIPEIIGKKSKVDIPEDTIISWDMID